MPAVIVVGAQWGDEGKGKIVDLLSAHAHFVVRSQGGNNAGHTVVTANGEFKLHLIPSGILNPHVISYIGAGTVVDPEVLLEEIEGLKGKGVALEGRLFISKQAHVIFPYHKVIDQKNDEKLQIGTTSRGIGPCYADKINRIGIRMEEVIQKEVLKKKLEKTLEIKNRELERIYESSPLIFEEVYERYLHFGERLSPFVKQIEMEINEAIAKECNVIFEGAQGTFLDISFGSYPFATSCNTTASGICAGAGVGPTRIDHTLGVVKAYTTRVGGGPLPTEIEGCEALFNHQVAREFGTTTGRKRRLGWLDMNLVKKAVYLNGLDSLALTKLDVLDSFDEIKICVDYDKQNEKPLYEVFPGWKHSLQKYRTFEELPHHAKNLLNFIEKEAGVPLSIISIGPQREETIVRREIFQKGSSPKRIFNE